MAEGKNREAYYLLNQGLHALQQLIENRHTVVERWTVSTECKVVIPVQLSSSQIDANLTYSPDNFFHLYEKAFVVTNDAVDTMHPHALQDRVAATIMYNVGLLCHRQALLRGNSTMLQRALFMYEMATSTVGRAFKGKTQIDEMDGLFMMALTNNMGHIYSHLFQLEEAMSCRRALEELVTDAEEPERHFFLDCLQFREFGLTNAPAA